MAVDSLQYAIGNSASTTLSAGVTNTDTSAPLTSDTNFNAKSGEGMVLIDEGAATEEIAYATTKTGGALTIPLANRGLEGGSAQAHASGATVTGIVTAGMWNNLVDAMTNVVLKTTGAIDTSKVMKITSGDGQLATGGNIQVNSADPKRAFYIPANALMGATTNGAASGQVETSTYKVNYKVLDFDQSTEEYAILTIPSPHYWDASTVTVQFIWTAASGTGDVVWACQGVAFANDDALDTDYGTRQKVTDSLITAGDAHFTSFTSAITIAGTPTAGDLVSFRIYRIPGDAADTLNADARLIGVKIRFTIGQFDDQ